MLRSQVFVVSPEVLSQEVAGETVLLDLDSEQYFGLDEIGTRVWQLLMSGADIQKVLELMMTEFDVDEGTLERDVNELLSKLVENGLIRAIDGKNPQATS